MESESISDYKPLKKILLEDHESEIVKDTSKEKDSSETMAAKIKKPNKAMTPYIAFVKGFKEKHGSLAFKELGKIWNEISIEEKQQYVRLAEEDMIRYKKEMEIYVDKLIIIFNKCYLA